MTAFPTGRPVRVHGLAEARLACAVAAELGVPLQLVSAPAGAAHAGALWFREVVALAAAEAPGVAVTGVLDCADRAGDAQGAIAAGVPAVLFTGPSAVALRLADVATDRGVTLLTRMEPALDPRLHAHPARAIRLWLEGASVSE